MPKTSSDARGRAGTAFAAVALALTLFAPPAAADTPDFNVERATDDGNTPGIEFSATQRSSAAHGGSPSVGGGSGGGPGSGSAVGGGAPAVPAASEAPGGASVPGGRAAGRPMEMVCTGEREGIPGSAARPGDAGAVSSHCQYVAGTAPTTPPAEGEPADEGGAGEGEAPPSTETIVRTALARVAVSGAGLSWQPRNKSYTNVGVPTIVYAASPTQSHTTALFGREVSITLTASRYSYDFGDSTPPLVTTRAGEPWRRGNKEARLTHHYEETTSGGERRTITLTTTWDATTTNPFTGQTLTLPSIITTTEQSSPFPVSHLRIDLTDTADEQDGH